VRLLKYANSALVGVSREITTVREAVVLLGMRVVRMMALSFSLISTDDRRACPGFDYTRFWSYSLVHAVAAQHLAKDRSGTSPPEEAFAAGLLAGMGKLVFAVAMPQEYAEILAKAGGTLADASALERERFGADYRQAGGELLTEWGIPKRLAIAVEYQCEPDHAAVPPELQSLVRVVNEARRYAELICVSGGDKTATPPVEASPAATNDAQAADAQAAADARQANLILNIRREFEDISAILSLDRTSEMDVAAIQAKAGEVLTELSLTAQLHREAVESENEGVQVKAWTDGLTGIANRAALDSRLEALWHEAMQSRKPIGLALLDIDFFKKFNDAYGRRTGDAVLRAVAQALQPCVRQVDFVARYGGEEFAIIMPNADRLVAAGICVSIRRAIEQQIVEFEGKQHRVTVSLGSAVLPCASSQYSAQLLIEAANQQLYRSKDRAAIAAACTNCRARPSRLPWPSGGNSALALQAGGLHDPSTGN
jgi:diguanylate cyclase (GGDEF)-like protein